MKRILVIEDNPDVRDNTAELLELAGFEVGTAEDGMAGVAKAREWHPDMIVCDIMMPKLDGYGVLRILSTNPDTAGIPFIFLTAKAEKADMRKGMILGADDYLTKPFEESDLLDAIEIRLKKRTAVQDKAAQADASLEGFVANVGGLKALDELSNEHKVRTFKKKQVLYMEGDPAHYLYQVKSGSIKTTRTDQYGKELVTSIHNAGDFFGYASLLDGRGQHDTATALEDTELVLIPGQDFLTLLQSNRDVGHEFIKLLARNVRENEERLLKLAYASVRERVADVLLQLHSEHDADGPITLSRDDLAAMAGTATESLIRTLSEIKDEGTIAIVERKIYVKDVPALRKLAMS